MFFFVRKKLIQTKPMLGPNNEVELLNHKEIIGGLGILRSPKVNAR